MLSDERGMTLVELLVAIAIAMIVSLGAFGLVETVMRRSGEVGARVDTTQRARAGMDDITRQLRSQVCVVRADPSPMTTARSVYTATATSVTFFADTADESWRTGVTSLPLPTLRTLALNDEDEITETVRPGVADTAHPGLNAVTFASATGERTRTLATDVVVDGTTPLFRYYAFDTSTPPQPNQELTPGAGGLTEAQLQQVARIAISFRVLPAGRDTTRGSTVLHDDITVRSIDPNSSAPKPTCT